MKQSVQWRALAREAGLAAESVAVGLTEIRRANAAQTGIYSHAFFSLTIGLERIMKLILVTDFMLQNAGKMPNDKYIRQFGHGITGLVDAVRTIESARALKLPFEFPDDQIVAEIVAVLNDFAEATRYYNLDVLVGGRSQALSDPLAAWSDRVGTLIFARHYKPARRGADERRAAHFGALLQPVMSVQFISETGASISSVEEMLLQSSKTALLQKWGQFHSFRLVRYLANFLNQLGNLGYSKQFDMPVYSDFFRIFNNDDAYAKSVKTWKII